MFSSRASFNCIKVFADDLTNSKCGRIINLTSTVDKAGCPPCYCLWGIKGWGGINLTNALAKELAHYVTMNAIAPGNIDTDMTSSAGSYLVN